MSLFIYEAVVDQSTEQQMVVPVVVQTQIEAHNGDMEVDTEHETETEDET